MSTIIGTPVVPGVAFAPAKWVRRLPLTFDYPTGVALSPAQIALEIEAFSTARDLVARRLRSRAKSASTQGAELLNVGAEMTLDPQLTALVFDHIRAGNPALRAVGRGVNAVADSLRQAGGLAAERVADLFDVRDRITAAIMGQPEPGLPRISEPVVLVADDLAPSDAAGMDPELVMAIVTAGGAATSHTSVIARELGIACIVGAHPLTDIVEGQRVLVDATAGRVRTDFDPDEATHLLEVDRDRRGRITSWTGPALLASGQAVNLLANVQDPHSALVAARSPAQGIGLVRTEIPFLRGITPPALESQVEAYAKILEAFAGKRVVFRSLDTGSNTAPQWARMLPESNPALGLRGIRFTRSNRELVPDQLAAMALACERTGHPRSECWVMAPMISTVQEATDFASLVREVGLVPGVLVEVPAAALIADRLAEQVDFLTVGSNDMTQYVMAADRTNPLVASYCDVWHPAVLNMIDMVIHAGRCAGKPVGLSGEAAADPLLAGVFVGMGIDSLSMASAAIAWVGVSVGEYTRQQCSAAAQACLGAVDADQAHERARQILQGYLPAGSRRTVD